MIAAIGARTSTVVERRRCEGEMGINPVSTFLGGPRAGEG